MKRVSVSIDIKGSKEKVWSVITNIEDSVNTVSAIKKIEILEQGDTLGSLKWRETRDMFGTEATEVMWVHKFKEYEYCEVRAESHGSKYFTNFYLVDNGETTTLTIEFLAEIYSIKAKIMNFIFGWLFKKSTINAFKQDLEDIKKVVEQ